MKFRSDPSAIRGSIAPVVTPFTADGAVDHDGLRALIALAAGLRLARHLARRLHRRAQRADRRRADRRRCVRRPRRSATGCRSCPAPARAKLDETLELTAAARDAGRGRGPGHHPVLRAPHPGGAVPVVRHGRPGVPRPADRRLQRALPHGGGHRPGDGRAAVHRLRQLRRASRRRPRTSSTSRACCTPAAADCWCGPASSCCACRCSPWAAPGSSAPWPTSRPAAVARMYELWEAGDLDGARDLHYRAAPAGRPAVRRDQPGAGQVGPRPAGPDRLAPTSGRR